MKKLLSLIAILSLFISLSMAQTPVKLKKDGTPDKRYSNSKEAKSDPAVKLKKDGTPDKRYGASKTTNDATVRTETVNERVTKTTSRTKPAATEATKKAYKPTVDRSLSGPNGEQILTGPRGGRYYINKNGNKTYVKREN